MRGRASSNSYPSHPTTVHPTIGDLTFLPPMAHVEQGRDRGRKQGQGHMHAREGVVPFNSAAIVALRRVAHNSPHLHMLHALALAPSKGLSYQPTLLRYRRPQPFHTIPNSTYILIMSCPALHQRHMLCHENPLFGSTVTTTTQLLFTQYIHTTTTVIHIYPPFTPSSLCATSTIL